MIPKELNLEEFAQSLATEASKALPPELPDVVKKTVTKTVYDFIKIAGNALNNEKTSYDQNETILVCQLVGEWMYHKGIDNYKNQIPQEYWQPILQQIAFAIFEGAKKGVNQGLSQDEIITLAENAVTTTYKSLIEQLANEGKLTKSVDEIMNQSNLQDYVEQNYNEEEVTPAQSEKDIKLAAMALFFKTLPPETVGKIVKNLGENERRQLVTYMEMKDLEKLVDPVLYNQYLEKFHNFMPKVQQKKRKDAMYSKFTNALDNITKEELEEKIQNERKNVKNFLLRLYSGKIEEEDVFSMDITNTIINYVIKK